MGLLGTGSPPLVGNLPAIFRAQRCRIVGRLSTLVHSISKSDGLFAQGLDFCTDGIHAASRPEWGVEGPQKSEMLSKSQF